MVQLHPAPPRPATTRLAPSPDHLLKISFILRIFCTEATQVAKAKLVSCNSVWICYLHLLFGTFFAAFGQPLILADCHVGYREWKRKKHEIPRDIKRRSEGARFVTSREFLWPPLTPPAGEMLILCLPGKWLSLGCLWKEINDFNFYKQLYILVKFKSLMNTFNLNIAETNKKKNPQSSKNVYVS